MSKPVTPWPACDFSGLRTLGPCPVCGWEIGTAGYRWLDLILDHWCVLHPNETHPKAIGFKAIGFEEMHA